MKMTYYFDEDACLKDVEFDGLTGREYVTSTKDALNVMKIKNPAIDFSDDVKRGVYDDVSDEEYKEMLETVKCMKDLWHYPGDPKDRIQSEMNVLMLLANAIELISRQSVQLRSAQDGDEE